MSRPIKPEQDFAKLESSLRSLTQDKESNSDPTPILDRTNTILLFYQDDEFSWADEPVPAEKKRSGIDLRNVGNFYKYFNGTLDNVLLTDPDSVPKCLIRFIVRFPHLYRRGRDIITLSFYVEDLWLDGQIPVDQYEQTRDIRQNFYHEFYPIIADFISTDDQEFNR